MKRLLAAAAAVLTVAAVSPALAIGSQLPPEGPTGIALDARVELAWNTVPGATSYNVYRGTTPTSITTQIATGVLTNFYTDTTAANGTTYYYAVRTVSSGVESGDSLVVQSTPKPRSCATGNESRLENCYPGNASWTLQNPNAPSGIEGFATVSSINKGESADLKISTDSAANYRLEIYRTGFYSETTHARLFSIVRGLQGTTQPSCTTDGATGLVDCSNWAKSATISTTPSWPSGVYLIRLVREDNGSDNHIILVVRDDARHSDILYGTGVATYQAYNNYGGKSLYDFNSTGAATVAGSTRAVKVSYDRPYAQSRGGGHNWFTLHEHSWVSWLEEQGYDIAYQADTDMEQNGARVRDHNVYVLAAHDEYYSSAMRGALEQARDGGTDLLSTGANQVYWKIRFENSGGGTGRIQVCYKSTQSGGPDPSGIPTGTWRDPAGANRPENGLFGVMYVGDNDTQDFPLVVTAAQGADPIYRGTTLAGQPAGTSTSVGSGLVGWEWDARVANGSEPAGVVTLSSSSVSGSLIQNNGANSAPGSTTVSAVKYRAPVGSLVFSTGTNQWYKGLAATQYALASPDVRIQQTTMNVLTDMGATPQTPAAGLTVIPTPPGGGGGDPGGGTTPTVTEKIPSDGATQVGTTAPVRATFSTDMNAATITASSFTLAPAAGGPALAATVSYDAPTRTATLTPTAALAEGTAYRASLSTTIQSATNDALAATTWTFTTFTCPCRLFPTTSAPQSLDNPVQDGRPGPGPFSYELGVKVTVSQPMQVRGLSFYKTALEHGIHTAKIWDGSGAIIASAEFALETASGWQYQPLASALTLQPGQTYVVSVNINEYFALTSFGLASQVSNGPLQTVATGNGVYAQAAGQFPSGVSNNGNYFVDLEVVDPGTALRPSVTSVTPKSLSASAPGATAVTATFSTSMSAASINGSTFTLTGPGGAAVPATVTYDGPTRTARLTPSAELQNGTAYTANLAASISSTGGITLGSPATWTFTTKSACVCTLFQPTLTPAIINAPTQDGRTGPGPWSREFGVVITVVEQTKLTAFRYYRAPQETGVHVGKLWANGAIVASATFPTETDSGWQHVALATPVLLVPGTTYTVSVNANDFFVVTPGSLAQQVTAGSAQTIVGQNGAFSEAAGLIPNQVFNTSNYFVDLQVADDPLVPPAALTDASPRGHDVDVQLGSTVRATFSRDMTASTITGSSFTLTGPGGAVPASVTYNGATKTATLTPSSPLTGNTVYTASLATSIQASDATPLTNAITWSFKTVDATPPETTLTSTPPSVTTSASASFSFTSSDPAATFECALDGAAYSACTSPKSHTGLTDGSHTFSVRAKNVGGIVDPTPASFTWTVDTTAPTVTISAAPANPSNDPNASFTFSSEAGATFQCALDGGAFAACTSPKTYTALPDGPHTFQVKATDAAGNAGGATVHSWVLDTVAPTVTITANPTNPSGSTSATFTFASESGSSLECSLDGAPFTACTSPKTYTGITEGPHTFQVRAQDTAGNSGGPSNPASFAWTIDSAAPDTTITASPPASTNSTSASFSFTSEAGATFECQLDGGGFAACTSPKAYTALANGSHTFQVRAKDAAGNTDATPAGFTWTIDSTAPETTITAQPSSPSNSASASFSFTSEAGATFECQLDGSAFAACTSPKTYAGLLDGLHTFNVRAKDAAGNTDATPASFAWTIDTAAPDTTITASPPGTSNSANASFSFSSEAGATFECQLDGGGFAACTSPKSYTALANGSHTFQVRAKDAAGNTDATPATFTWTIDTTAPDTTITASPAASTNSSSASFSFTSEAGAAFECALDGGAFAACTSPKAYTGLADGSHTFQVRAHDGAGNTDATPASFTWTIDSAAPDTTITANPTNPSTSSSASFSFTSEAGATFECQLDGAAYAACTSPKSYTALADGSHTFNVRAKDAAGNTDATPAGFTWTIDATAPNTTITANPTNPSTSSSASFSFTSEAGATFECQLDGAAYAACTSPKSYTALADGSHTFNVRAKDAAGNTDATPATFTWTIDAVAPDTTITANPTNPSTSSSASFSFTSEAGATFECSLDGGAYAACTSPKSYTTLADGSHTFQVRAKDAAGNTDATPAAYTWTVDATAPDTTISSSPSNPTSATSATFGFSSEAGATFECSLDAAAFAACTSTTTYSSLAAGSHTFQVRAKDAAGNVDATPATYTWTIQNTAPTVTAQTPASGATGVATSSTVTATFSRAMDATTITSTSFTLSGPSGAVAATVAYNSATNVATLTPSAALANSTTYTANLATTIKAADGVALASVVNWSFTTAAASSAPTVVSVTPPNLTTKVDRAYSPTATFSTDMDATTINTTNFTLKSVTGASVAGVVTYNAATKTATFDPTVNLASLMNYTATLTTAIKSSGGVPLAAVYTWKFQTVAPNVAATYPNNGGAFMSALAVPVTNRIVQEISPWSPIEVEFTEPMDPATITTASIVVTDSTGAAVPGVVSYDPLTTTAVFDPTGLLDYGETYTVNVLPTIAAVDGALLETGYSWKFTATTIGSGVGIDAGSRLTDRHWTSSTDTLYLPDRARFNTGTSVRRDVTAVVTGTTDPSIYDDERVGTWSYTVPVPEGDYDIRLYFAETVQTAVGKRVFDVDVAETAAAPDFPRLDIFAAAGGANKPLVKTITNVTATPGTTGTRGTITIRSRAITGQPQISAFEIIPRRPRVVSTTPANGATGVSKTAPITFTFSTQIALTTLNQTNVHVTGPTGIDLPITGSWAALTKTATLTPTGGLAPNTRYTVTLDGTIKARTGLRMGAPYTWSFTTGP